MAKLKTKIKHSADTIEDLITRAAKCGIDNDYLFLSTLERYSMQVRILEDLGKAIQDDSTLVTKEYVKGRGNLYVHPAIGEYNKTVDSANKTVVTLNGILTTAEENFNAVPDDPLIGALMSG